MLLKPRVGFHNFLNSKPLIHAFEHGLVDKPFEMVMDTPSNLAMRFHDGDLDLALIPSVEYGRNKDAVIVPSLCIASRGKVDTVLLYSELAIEDVESICVDPKSRTSVAMLIILFKEMFGKEPTIVVGENNPDKMLDSADAGLLIGDAAYFLNRDKYVVHDLGELWYQYSALPFVHAILCAHRGKRWDHTIAVIEEAKRIGVSNRELIAKQETKSHQEADALLDYLTKRIYYDLGEQEREGLEFFFKTAARMKLVDRSDLEFY